MRQRRPLARAVIAAFALALLGRPAPARAHAFAPALLELRQTGPQAFAVRFKQPSVQPAGARLRPLLPAACAPTSPPTVSAEGTGVVATWTVACPGGLRGRVVAVEGIASLQADVLLRLELEPGGTIRHVLTADRPRFEVPPGERWSDVVRGYGRLGLEHILSGVDHLVFVLGLVLLVGPGRRLLWTVTAFTAGHSVTLALAALGVVRVPQAPVEALIALSIYVLAVELAERERRRRRATAIAESRMERRPGWMAASFGLLHGLGFAGALTAIGLPAGDVPAALFAFNLGIEAGQLLFVAAVLAVGAVARRALAGRPSGLPARLLAYAPSYAIGVLAAYWVLERAAG